MRRILLPCLLLALTGCAGYHLGPVDGSVAGGRSVQVNFFQNQTHEPRLVEAVNHSLRRSLQQDGTLRLDTKGTGDIVVSGTITRFERSGMSFQPGDVLTVRDYGLSMIANVRAIERSTGKVLLDADVAGQTIVRVGNDLASAERQAVPLLADDLAKRATTLLVEGKW